MAASGWSARASDLVIGILNDWARPRSGCLHTVPGDRVLHGYAFADANRVVKLHDRDLVVVWRGKSNC